MISEWPLTDTTSTRGTQYHERLCPRITMYNKLANIFKQLNQNMCFRLFKYLNKKSFIATSGILFLWEKYYNFWSTANFHKSPMKHKNRIKKVYNFVDNIPRNYVLKNDSKYTTFSINICILLKHTKHVFVKKNNSYYTKAY